MHRIHEWSGRSKPPSVRCGIRLCAIPGRIPDDPSALFWLAPAGIHRSIDPHCCAQRVNSRLHASRHRWLGRIIAVSGTCRFCARAMTLAIRICMRLRAWWVGGLSSVASCATVSRTLPLLLIFVGSIFTLDGCAKRGRREAGSPDRPERPRESAEGEADDRNPCRIPRLCR
jgi:hypothetical protein